VQTGQAYGELGELEAAEACLAKATEYATQLLGSCSQGAAGQPKSVEWLESIVELFIDRTANAWLLSQQVPPPPRGIHQGGTGQWRRVSRVDCVAGGRFSLVATEHTSEAYFGFNSTPAQELAPSLLPKFRFLGTHRVEM